MRALDDFLPAYEFSERHRVRVDAPAARVDAVLRDLALEDLPVARFLMRLRAFGRAAGGGRPFLEQMLRLEDAPGEGAVVGLTGQFWRLRPPRLPRPASAEEFLAYDRADVGKAVMDFRVVDGTLTTETRVHVPDPAARRRFARYWRLIRPFSGLIRIAFLREAKRRAEVTG